ncbi:MAG: hypothetical protein OXF01_15785 [Gemmatimonadetes bacterium]|nr:hypothetical protein [Gemmatimonadota bacterium]
MSRAFVREDREDPPPDYRLPDPGSEYFDEACAWALITGADEGDSRSAEIATGCRWGEPRLVPHIQAILARAETQDQTRVAQLCGRFLRAANTAGR